MSVRGPLRTFALGLLVAFVVTWGGCVAYISGVRGEVEGMRAELEASGAPLHVDAYIEQLGDDGDPRVLELLQSCQDAPSGSAEELSQRIEGLGVLGARRQAWWLEGDLDLEEPSEQPPVLGYTNLVNAVADGVRASLEAGDAQGAAEQLPDLLAAIDLVRPANLVFGLARAGLELHALWIVSDVVGALPPEASLPEELEPWIAGLDPRRSLEQLLEGERALALTQLERVQDAGLVGIEWIPAGELQFLLTERGYLQFMEGSFEQLEGSWADAQRRQDEFEEERRAGSRFDPLDMAAALTTPVLGALRAEFDVLALRDLALAGLAGRRGGAEAARAVLDGRVDPFTDGPYALEVGEDGALRMWSPGADGQVAGPPGWSRALEPSADDLRWIVPGR